MNRIGDNLLHFGPNETLIRAFVDFGVEFVLIGGLAISWYCSDRQVDDMDLLVNSTQENSERIYQALTHLNLSGFDNNSFSKSALQIPLKQHLYAEILTCQLDGPSYLEVAVAALDAKLFNIPIKLASVASLIKMKQKAVISAGQQREKHQADIERLIRYSAKQS